MIAVNPETAVTTPVYGLSNRQRKELLIRSSSILVAIPSPADMPADCEPAALREFFFTNAPGVAGGSDREQLRTLRDALGVTILMTTPGVEHYDIDAMRGSNVIAMTASLRTIVTDADCR